MDGEGYSAWLNVYSVHGCPTCHNTHEQQLPFIPWTGSQLEGMLGEFLPRMESVLQQLGFFYSNCRTQLVQVFTNVSEKWTILLTLRTERMNAAWPPVASPSSVWCYQWEHGLVNTGQVSGGWGQHDTLQSLRSHASWCTWLPISSSTKSLNDSPCCWSCPRCVSQTQHLLSTFSSDLLFVLLRPWSTELQTFWRGPRFYCLKVSAIYCFHWCTQTPPSGLILRPAPSRIYSSFIRDFF